MIVGAYSINLYCDNWREQSDNIGRDGVHELGEFPHEFAGHSKLDCFRQARAIGWKIGKERQTCPKCNTQKG